MVRLLTIPERTQLRPESNTRRQKWDLSMAAVCAETSRAERRKAEYEIQSPFIGRHGQATQNVAEDNYGIPEFRAKWAMYDGDGTLTWVDPPLTEKGRKSAVESQQPKPTNSLPIKSRMRRCPYLRAFTRVLRCEGWRLQTSCIPVRLFQG